jgi:hypothetical protein
MPIGSAAKPVDLIRNSYASTTVGTGAYVQIKAATTDHTSEIEISDTSGSSFDLAYGSAGNEQNLLIIPPGGNGRIPVLISKGARLSLKALDSAATGGQIEITTYRR